MSQAGPELTMYLCVLGKCHTKLSQVLQNMLLWEEQRFEEPEVMKRCNLEKQNSGNFVLLLEVISQKTVRAGKSTEENGLKNPAGMRQCRLVCLWKGRGPLGSPIRPSCLGPRERTGCSVLPL